MGNWEASVAWEYHNSTKHSRQSVSASRYHLDWVNLPRSYKLYTDLQGVPLPTEWPSSGVPALKAISTVEVACQGNVIPDLKTLASILHFSAGVTKWLSVPGGRMAFRAAACTGALYHIELYLVCGELPDLKAGVYHYGVHDESLRQLRVGDYRGFLTRAAGGHSAVADAPVTIICTSTYWRNSWKYQSRAYRHCFWDSGTILANMLAMAAACRMPAQVVAGFVDEDINRLLGVDSQKEVALSLVPVGHAPSLRPGAAPPVAPLSLATAPYSRSEVDYPDIQKMHAASSLANPQEVESWRSGSPAAMAVGKEQVPAQGSIPLAPLRKGEWSQESIERVIVRRGSSRHFQRSLIAFESLSTMLAAATGGLAADFPATAGDGLSEIYLIVNAVDGLASGTYRFQGSKQVLELLRAGAFRDEAGYLALGQQLGADAAVNVYFLADLGSILGRYGNRGYRLAQLAASITVGKLYLAAYALGLGATGLTFFDDDVIRLFSPSAEEKSVMFLLALGVPAARRSR